jgi:hypothetical protein
VAPGTVYLLPQKGAALRRSRACGKSKPSLLVPLLLFRVYGTGRRNGGIALFFFRENAALN